jgi:hypothetical protein
MLFAVLFPQPNIDIGVCIINEPIGALTNLLIALVALVGYLQLCKLSLTDVYLNYWKLFFATMTFAMLYAGCTHAFKWAFTPQEYTYVWLSMNLIGIVPTLFGTQASLSFSPSKYFNSIVYTLLSAVAVFTIVYNNFLFVKIAAGLGVCTILYMHIMLYKRTAFAPSPLIITGMCIGISTIVIHSLKLSLHTWCNYKDISHILMAVSVYVVYLGVKRYAIAPQK